MLTLKGERIVRVKKYVDNHVQCKECGSHTHLFEVFQGYYHVFFIPFIPYRKKIISSCTNCGCTLNEEKTDSYLKQTKTPLYMYSGMVVIALLIVWFMVGANERDELKKEYIATPLVGDVYVMKDTEQSNTYYFAKVKAIKEDTLLLLTNVYTYKKGFSRYKSRREIRFDDADYFDLSDPRFITKVNLQELLEQGTIDEVRRGYSENSNFNNEKEREEQAVPIE